MILQDALVEVRKNIYCANIFLKFDTNITSLNTSFKISLDKNCVVLSKESKTILNLILSDIELNAESLTNLIISNNQISFRISLKNIDNLSEINVKETKDNNLKKKCIKLLIEKEKNYKLICYSCENIIIPIIHFKRILDFPSNYNNVTDFFCHEGPDVKDLNEKLVPNNDDLFYGLFFIILNLKSLCNIKQTKFDKIHCRRCLFQLGETVLNCKAVKFWNDSVKLINYSNGLASNIFNITNNSQICYNIIENILKEYEILDIKNKNDFFQFTKIILLAKFSDKKKYLMLNIIEKNLHIYKNDESNIFKMMSGQGYKLFFKIESDENQALLRFWLNDINVHSLDISFSLFCKFVNILTNNSELFPQIFRNSQNGFLMSFIANL